MAALKLDHDPEFAGASANALGVALDLLSATGAAADPASRAEATLKHAVEILPNAAAGTILVRVTTGDSGKSMRIAARLAEAVSAAGGAGGNVETDTALRKTYDEVNAELAAFTAKSGEGNVKVAIDLRRQIDRLDADLKEADQNILVAKAQADRLKAAKLAEVLDGSLPSKCFRRRCMTGATNMPSPKRRLRSFRPSLARAIRASCSSRPKRTV